MKAKTRVVKWGNGGVVYERDGKIECYYLTATNTPQQFKINLTPMEITERIYTGPDCYPWRPVFAWWPVRTIGGRYVWLRQVYKQKFWAVWGTGFHMEPEVEYAELFDMLKDNDGTS